MKDLIATLFSDYESGERGELLLAVLETRSMTLCPGRWGRRVMNASRIADGKERNRKAEFE
jgi:hypothetical protein